jgi:hypothetical protein
MTIDEQMVEFADEMVRKYGAGHIISLQEIYRYFEKAYFRKQGSVIPSDYCYNRINNGIQLNKPTVFEYIGNGNYRCYGAGYPYNGTLYHKPKSQNEFAVGKCVNGIREVAPEGDYQLSDAPSPVKTTKILQTSNLHRTQRSPAMRMRFDVLKRDNFKCCACGASPSKDPAVELHIDHIIPWSKGGESTRENLQTLCSKCNFGKSNWE